MPGASSPHFAACLSRDTACYSLFVQPCGQRVQRLSRRVLLDLRNQAKVSTYLYLQTPPGRLACRSLGGNWLVLSCFCMKLCRNGHAHTERPHETRHARRRSQHVANSLESNQCFCRNTSPKVGRANALDSAMIVLRSDAEVVARSPPRSDIPNMQRREALKWMANAPSVHISMPA